MIHSHAQSASIAMNDSIDYLCLCSLLSHIVVNQFEQMVNGLIRASATQKHTLNSTPE